MTRDLTDIVDEIGAGGLADQTADSAVHPAGSRAGAHVVFAEGQSSYLGWLFHPTVLGLNIFRRILQRTLAIAACFCVVLLSVQLLGMVNFLITAQNVLVATLEICLLLLPPMIIIMLPFAVLMATHRTFEEMHEESELIVMAAIGRSRGQRAAPALAAAGLLSVTCLAISLFVEPVTNRMADQLKAGIRVDILGHAAQTGGFHKIGENLLVQIGGLAADGALINVLIVDMRTAEGERIYFARQGRASDLAAGSSIALSDGELLIKNRTTKSRSRLQFSRYALSLADVMPRGGEPVARVQSKTTLELMSDCGGRCRTSDKPEFAREINRRLSDWLYIPAFAVITAWFGSRSRPNRSATRFGMVALILLGMVLRGSGFVALAGSGDSLVAASLVYLVPISALLLPFVLSLRDRPASGSGGGLRRRVLDVIGGLADIARMPALSHKIFEPRHRSRF